MPSPQPISRLLLIVLAIPFFLVSAASTVASASRSLAYSPSNVSFGNVQVGNEQGHYETLTNSGNATVTISQAAVTGAGFSLSGLTLPLSLNKGQSATFTILFTPKVGGSSSGGIRVVSNASNSSLTIALSGTGIAAGQLTPSATTLNFGSVTLGTSKTLTAALTATGSSVTVSSATTTSSEFSIGGFSLPKVIAAGQSTSFTLTFTPRASGAASGTISLTSNAANTPTLETLTGSGAATVLHSVDLSWSPSASTVLGYNVYRSTISGGPYTKVTPAPSVSTSYVDTSALGGNTYYYVSTALDSHGVESTYSNQWQAVIPSP